jgi:hypothetical protein
MISAADVDLEGAGACGVGNQLRRGHVVRTSATSILHDIIRTTSARQHAARAKDVRELSEAGMGIADGDADEEERCGLEKVAALLPPTAQRSVALVYTGFGLVASFFSISIFLGGLFPKGAACFMWARSPLGGVGLVPLARAVGSCHWGPVPVKKEPYSQVLTNFHRPSACSTNQRPSLLSRTPSSYQDHNRMRKPKVPAVALAERRRSAIEAQAVISTATSSRSFEPPRCLGPRPGG